jgi:hypothetical protein
VEEEELGVEEGKEYLDLQIVSQDTIHDPGGVF